MEEDQLQTYKIVYISCQTDNEEGLEALRDAYDLETLKGRVPISHDLYKKDLASAVSDRQAAIICGAHRHKVEISTEVLLCNHVGINTKVEIDIYLAVFMGKNVKFTIPMDHNQLQEIMERVDNMHVRYS